MAESEWLTVEEAADWLRVPARQIHEAVERGDLPVLRIGIAVRLSRTALITRAGAGAAAEHGAVVDLAVGPGDPASASDDRVAAPAALRWVEPLATAEAFQHGWPRRGGGSYIEQYPRAWAGRINVSGTEMRVLVGEATGAERHDKTRRLTVLFDGYPISEFAPTADGNGWASLIKPDGRHTVAPTDALPRLYRSARVMPYHQATGLGGRGRPTGVAVVIEVSDMESAVHHAAARWLGKTGRSSDPAA